VGVVNENGVATSLRHDRVRGICRGGVCPFLRRLRWFPAEMAGLVVLLVGIVIGSLAVRDIGQLFAAGSDERIWTAIAVTFGTMTVLAVWGTQLLSLLAVLGGILAGIIYACIVGLLTPSAFVGLASDPIIAPPPIGRFGVGFDATLVLPFAVAAIATATKAAGVVGLALHRTGQQGDAGPLDSLPRRFRRWTYDRDCWISRHDPGRAVPLDVAVRPGRSKAGGTPIELGGGRVGPAVF